MRTRGQVQIRSWLTDLDSVFILLFHQTISTGTPKRHQQGSGGCLGEEALAEYDKDLNLWACIVTEADKIAEKICGNGPMALKV